MIPSLKEPGWEEFSPDMMIVEVKITFTYMQLGCLVTKNAILHPADVSKILFSLQIIYKTNSFIVNQMGTN